LTVTFFSALIGITESVMNCKNIFIVSFADDKGEIT
jgi:hypothetical protein